MFHLLLFLELISSSLSVRVINIPTSEFSGVKSQFAISYPLIYNFKQQLPKIDKTDYSYLIDNKQGCYQYVSSKYGLFDVDKRSCNLPNYCKDIEFKVVSYNWWANTGGICIGISGEVLEYKQADGSISSAGFSDNWWRLSNLTFERIIFKAGNTQYQSNPLMPKNFVLLQQHNLNNYMIYPKFALNGLPTYHFRYGLQFPETMQENGRFCTPRYSSDRLNLLHGARASTIVQALKSFPAPFDLTDMAISNVKLNRLLTSDQIIDLNSSMIYHKRFAYMFGQSFSIEWINEEPKLMSHDLSHFHSYNCDPYIETTSTLPIQFSWLTSIITHIFTVLYNWFCELVDYTISSVNRLIHITNHSYYLYEYLLIYLLGVLYFRDLYSPIALLVLGFSLIGFNRY